MKDLEKNETKINLKVQNLSFTYNHDLGCVKSVLNNVSFELFARDFLGVVGENGSGKSTLGRVVGGLLKPTSGEVVVNGVDISNFLKKKRNNRFKISVVFQIPEDQLFMETVQKDISFGPKNMGLNSEEVNCRVRSAIRFVGLDESFLSRSMFELSGGEKRKVAIAGIVAMKPDLLILDEPTAGLDSDSSKQILINLKNYCEKSGAILVLVTHSLEEITRYTNKILVLKGGKKKFFGKTSSLLKLNTLEKLDLQLPDHTDILVKLKKLGYNVKVDDIFSVKKAAKAVLELLKKCDTILENY